MSALPMLSPSAALRGVFRAAALAAAMAVPLAAGAAETAYPTKPVRIVAGFPPGGAADLLARLAAERLERSYKQSFIVENRAGAGGTIGAASVANSAPDGYSLLLGLTASQTIAPAIYPQLPYDPAKDFAPVAMVATIPVALVVHPSLGVNTAQELIAKLKSSDTPLTFASSGNGAIPHLTAELFKASQGVRMEHIPFRGAPAAMGDLLAGRVPIMFDHLPSVLPHIQSGSLKVLGIAGEARAAGLPEVPTLQEQGIDGVVVRSWFGMLAPAGTPPAVVDSLSAALTEELAGEAAQTRLAAMGAEFSPAGPREFEEIIKADTAMWAEIVKQTDARAD